MKKFLLSLMLLMFMISLVVGCGEKADVPADNAPSGEPEEVADTTRLDEAATEATEATEAADTTMAEEGDGWGQ